MTLAWMIYLLFVGTAVALSALALDAVLRRTRIATRWVWVLAMGAVVVLALVQLRSPAPVNLPLEIQLVETASDAPLSPTSSIAVGFLQTQQQLYALMNAAIVTASAQLSPNATRFVLGGWAATSALLALVLLLVTRRVQRERQAWPVTDVLGTRVRIAPAVGPAVVGLTRPEIVLPAWLLGRDADEQRLVLLHEREHLAARDNLLPLGAWIVVALLPWHPSVWWMLSRLRLAIELDCDARVLRHGVSARPYGLLLIDIAGRSAGRRAGVMALADGHTHLERRIRAMKQKSSRYAVVRGTAFAAVAALSLVVACEAKLPTEAEITQMDAASVANNAQIKALLGERAQTPIYVVDGVQVTERMANSINAEVIASVGVAKGDNGSAGTINIVTTKGQPIQVAGERIGGAGSDTGLKEVRVRSALSDFSGIFFVDHVRSNESAMRGLAANDIGSVEVVKGNAARAMFPNDPAAASGIILVFTKKWIEANPGPRLTERVVPRIREPQE